MFLALLTSFGSVWVYVEQGGGEVSTSLPGRLAWTLVCYMSGAWAIVFGIFVVADEKAVSEHILQNTMDYFLKGEDNAVKSITITDNIKLLLVIRGEVKKWIREEW